MKKLLLIFLLLPALSFSQTDLSLDSVFHRMGVGGFYPSGLDYFKLAPDESTPFSFSAIISNVGSENLTNCFLDVMIVDDSGDTIYWDQSTSTDLLVSESDSVFLTSTYELSELGEYLLCYEVISDSIEDDLANNFDTIMVELDDYHHSRSNGITTDVYDSPFSSGTIYGRGNVMEIQDHLCVAGIWIHIADTSVNVGREIFGELWVYNEDDTAWNFVAITDDYSVMSYDLGNDIYIYFDHGHEFFAGDVIAAGHGHYGGLPGFQMSFSQRTEYGTAVEMTCYPPLAAYDQLTVAAGVKPTYGECWDWDGIDENGQISIRLNSLSPNPSSSFIVIGYELRNKSEVQIAISDLFGRQVYTDNLGLESAGDHTYQLLTDDWSDGTYFISIEVNGQKQTERLVVTH